MAYYAYYAFCEYCGADLGLVEQEGGRPRRYCSDACKQAAYRERKRREKRNKALLRYAPLVEEWRRAGFSDQAIERLRTLAETYDPNAAKIAAEVALLTAREAREAVRRAMNMPTTRLRGCTESSDCFDYKLSVYEHNGIAAVTQPHEHSETS